MVQIEEVTGLKTVTRKEEDMEKRAVGALVGAAVGDALGAPLEWTPPRTPDAWFYEMMEDNRRPNYRAGDITDDTEMALGVAEMYLHRGGYDQHFLVKHWLGWAERCNWDMGRWTKDILMRWHSIICSGGTYGQDWREGNEYRDADNHPAIKLWQERKANSAGNGGVMRCMPTALYQLDIDQRISDTIKICQDTHPDPRCVESCIAVVETLRNLIDGARDKLAVVDNVSQLLPKESVVRQALETADLLPVEELENKGYTVNTVECAFSGFLHANDFENGLLAVVNQGNDADTVGAIAGSLLGAYYGIDKIPQRWLDMMTKADYVRDMAEKIFRY
jgi:ADP-ribosylglycohydrolase